MTDTILCEQKRFLKVSTRIEKSLELVRHSNRRVLKLHITFIAQKLSDMIRYSVLEEDRSYR